jgi:hypothetical protein
MVYVKRMKKQLETLPILDAYGQYSECPLCFLTAKLEKSLTDFFLGASVMEPITREQTNKKGFCPAHSLLLFRQGNRHGLALLTHTRLLELNPRLARALESVKQSAGVKRPLLKSILAAKKEASEKIGALNALIAEQTASCAFCDKINQTIDRYVFTIVYLWRKEADFRDTFHSSKGFCLPHLPPVLDKAVRLLSPAHLKEFLGMTLNLEGESMKRLEEEVLWFTQKFDYRNNEKPWGNSKDSLPRALQKLNGRIFETGTVREKEM